MHEQIVGESKKATGGVYYSTIRTCTVSKHMYIYLFNKISDLGLPSQFSNSA